MPYISQHGYAFGFDSESGKVQRPALVNYDDEEGLSVASTASNIKWRGTTTITTTAAKDYTMNAPLPETIGMSKTICQTSSSTAVKTVSLASGNFLTTLASSALKATFTFANQALTLVALSTSLVQIKANNGTVTLST